MQDSTGKTICYHLGYIDDLLEPIIMTNRQPLVLGIMENLNQVDTALNSAILDSMAVQVGDLKVDYSGHITQLKTQGSMLLLQLSMLTGLAIAYNRFMPGTYDQNSPNQPGSPNTSTGYPLAIQSYW